MRTSPCDANFAAEGFAGEGEEGAVSPPYFAIYHYFAIFTIAIHFVL